MRIKRIIDILNSEARASFSPNGNLRTSSPWQYVKVGNVVQLFPRYRRGLLSYSTFKVSQDLRCRILARGLRLCIYNNV